MEYLHAEWAVTGDGTTVLSPAWIGIEDGFIRTAAEERPADADHVSTVELKDATLIPGLMNIHDHICRKILRIPDDSISFGARTAALMAEEPLYLILHSTANMRAYLLDEGITWVRDFGLAGLTSLHLKRAISEGLIPGPEIDACGEPICMTGGHCWRQSCEADGPDEVVRAVRLQARNGATIIKFMGSGGLEHFPREEPSLPQFSIEELRAGTEAARDLGLDTALHAYSTEGIRRGIAAGVGNIEHGALMSADQAAEMAEKGICFNPTMSGLRAAFSRGPNRRYWDELNRRIYSIQEQAMRNAQKAGVLIGAGTDSLGYLRDELQLIMQTLEETPVQALAHATSINARIARRPDLGVLEPGRRADIAAFRGNLSVSLDPLKEPALQVWKNGIAGKGN